MDEIWTKIADWYEANCPDRSAELGQGASPEELAQLQAMLEQELPEDYLLSLSRHNSLIEISDYSLLPLSQVITTSAGMNARIDAGDFENANVFDDESLRTQLVWWHKAWVPFAEDSGGNLFCIDLAPGPEGKVGQIIRHERHAGPVHTGLWSFKEWMADYLEKLKSGHYIVDEEGYIVPA